MGTKTVIIDPGKLDGMLMYGATCLECSDEFDCSNDTIERFIKSTYGMTFADYSDKKRSHIRMKLRRKQVEVALKGNVTMLIFLGKAMLNQSDFENRQPGSNLDSAIIAKVKELIHNRSG